MTIYNTIMALATGAGLITFVRFMRWSLLLAPAADEAGIAARRRRIDGTALVAGVLGMVLFATGLHMTLAWPLHLLPFDNIIFGEPVLAEGLIFLAASIYLWRRRDEVAAAPNLGVHLAEVARPFTAWLVGLGLALIAVFFVGNIFQLFAAPPHEPITGIFAQYPWAEALIISGIYGLIGIGLILLPFGLKALVAHYEATGTVSIGSPAKIAGWLLMLMGVTWLLFGALNYYTHVGMIHNEMTMAQEAETTAKG